MYFADNLLVSWGTVLKRTRFQNARTFARPSSPWKTTTMTQRRWDVDARVGVRVASDPGRAWARERIQEISRRSRLDFGTDGFSNPIVVARCETIEKKRDIRRGGSAEGARDARRAGDSRMQSFKFHDACKKVAGDGCRRRRIRTALFGGWRGW